MKDVGAATGASAELPPTTTATQPLIEEGAGLVTGQTEGAEGVEKVAMALLTRPGPELILLWGPFWDTRGRCNLMMFWGRC